MLWDERGHAEPDQLAVIVDQPGPCNIGHRTMGMSARERELEHLALSASQADCRASEGAPSGWSLASAVAIMPKMCSVCQQVSWCGPVFQPAMTPSLI